MSVKIPISAGNWKMHGTNINADELCIGLREIKEIKDVQIVLAPSYLQLNLVRDYFNDTGAGTEVGIAAQNMHFSDQGAFTGEVSPKQVAEVADWVILGHSERRQMFCENDAALNRKVLAALSNGISPILCVGERLEELEAGRTEAVLTRQVKDALTDVTIPMGFVIAYEPVWAIGTGVASSTEEVEHAASVIRRALREITDERISDGLRILYGGSVNPGNVEGFMNIDGIDGVLVGGASLSAADFLAITRIVATSVEK